MVGIVIEILIIDINRSKMVGNGKKRKIRQKRKEERSVARVALGES